MIIFWCTYINYTYLKQGVSEAGVIAQEVEAVLPQTVSRTEVILNDGRVLKDAL
ncbi:tail fiber domain-containing protein, partial [Pseudoalteromonas lipolytica]|uniref:tail fiber domain-containing protein n=1 Tax=Pseudoalteromonas lipolytica TaxID=570156 RepID=UPI003A96A1C4